MFKLLTGLKTKLHVANRLSCQSDIHNKHPMPTFPPHNCYVGPNCASQSQLIPMSIRPAHIKNMPVCQMLRPPLASRLSFTKPTYPSEPDKHKNHNMLVNRMNYY